MSFLGSVSMTTRSIFEFLDNPIWVDGVAYKPRDLTYADPIMDLLREYHRETVAASCNPRYLDKSIIHCRPVQRNSYLAGLRIIMDYLRFKNRESLRDAFPSWNRRRSVVISGGLVGRDEAFIYQRLGTWSLPSGFSNSPQTKVRSAYPIGISGGGAGRYMYFNDIVLFARKLIPFIGMQFKRTGSLGIYTQHILRDLTVSQDKVEYVLDSVLAQKYPSNRSASVGTLRVTIQHFSPRGEPPRTEIWIRGLNSTRGQKDTNPPVSFDLRFPEFVGSYNEFQLGMDQFLQEKEELKGERFIRSLKIDDLRGALFHTQGKALSSIALDLDRNFENVVESAEFFPMLSDLVLDPKGKLKEIFSEGISDWRRVKLVADVLSSSVLAYNFGIKPAVEALLNLLQPYVHPAKGEGELVYERSAVSELPDGLNTLVSNALIWAYGSDDINHIKIKFRSEAWTTPTYVGFVQQLYNENILFRAGVIPTPSGVWDATSRSFILDWQLPVGTMIEDNFQYMTSFNLPFRVGHSVRFEIDCSDGRSLDYFIRSSEANFPLDPPELSWLEAPGVPPIGIAVSTSMLLGLT